MVAQDRLDTMDRMRQSGTSLQQIASHFGITRQRVGQLLAKHYGSTRIQDLLTATELARLAGCTQSYIDKLQRRGVIQPAKVVGRGRTLWKPETTSTVTIYVDSHRCRVCNRPLPSNRQVYCCWACYVEACRYKNRPEQARRRQRESVAKWIADHPEQARQIEQRKQTKYRAKKSAERYQNTEYIIWRKCLIPLSTIVRVPSYNKATGRIKVEWGDQVVELPFGCVRRVVN